MTKGVHRVPAGSKRARQMVRAKGSKEFDECNLTPAQVAWNAQLEAKRKAEAKSNG